jgi:hypothetical protein
MRRSIRQEPPRIALLRSVRHPAPGPRIHWASRRRAVSSSDELEPPATREAGSEGRRLSW